MQANGAAQNREPDVSCRNGAPNGESSSSGAAHSNGPLPAINNGSAAISSSGGASEGAAGSRKKKHLSQSEEDVIRLIGQHLHDLGLK